MAFDAPLTAGTVTAPLNYLVPMAEKPVAYNYEPPPGTPWRTGQYEARPVAIRDGRPFNDRLSLDKEGFHLLRDASAVSDFYDEGEVESVYYPELERLVKQATGAARVVVFDTTIRTGKPLPGRKPVKEPARRIHNDYTEKSGPQRVRDLLPADEAEALLRGRFAVVNVWRPIRGPVLEAPLALCDATSIAPEDLVATDLKYPDRTGETYSVTFSPRHRWFYFPRMAADEVVLIKCYDSARDGRARFTAHGAFDDHTPTSPPASTRTAPGREHREHCPPSSSSRLQQIHESWRRHGPRRPDVAGGGRSDARTGGAFSARVSRAAAARRADTASASSSRPGTSSSHRRR